MGGRPMRTLGVCLSGLALSAAIAVSAIAGSTASSAQNLQNLNCPMIWQPVCGIGKDGKKRTWANDCWANKDGAKKIHPGACK
jgi:hypothetical protein